MKTQKISSVSFMALLIFLSFNAGLLAQTPGIECGCTKYDKYVKPALKGILMKGGQTVQEGTSKSGKYSVIAEDAIPPNITTITIYYYNTPILNLFSRATGWGFSPDEDKFVLHGIDQNGWFWFLLYNLDPDPTSEGEQAENVLSVGPTNVSSSRISFSPHGMYLLYAAIGNSGNLVLKIYKTKTGEEVYDGSTQSPIVGDVDGKSIAGWGFSPDKRDRTFVHAFLTDYDKYALKVKNLEKGPDKFVLNAVNNSGGANFRFSPCGDYFLWTWSNSTTDPTCYFYKTSEENTTYDESGSGVGMKYAYTKADGHYIKYFNGSLKIFDNTADNSCDDHDAPSWSGGSLDASNITGTRVELSWSGASDNNGVTNYKLLKNGSLYKKLDTETHLSVTGLLPENTYHFKVEAGDAAGNWSSNGPSVDVTTTSDDIPYWVNGSLTFSKIQGTRIKLNWAGATDDYGIRLYKVFQDGNQIGMISGDSLTYEVTRLTPETTYTFRIEAGDDADQWSSDGPELIQLMPPDNPPSWPAGADITLDEKTETTLSFHWSDANDDNGITKYAVYRNGTLVDSFSNFISDFNDDNLEAGTTYYYSILAGDEAGNWSDSLSKALTTVAPFVEYPLITAQGTQSLPDIDDKQVVWQDTRNGNADIYIYDLENHIEDSLIAEEHWQGKPAIYRNDIVWEDARNGNSDIYALYPSAMGRALKRITVDDGVQSIPQTDDNKIVWADLRNGDWDIYMYDLKTSQEKAVCTAAGKQTNPSIFKNFIVWEDYRNGNPDIYAYDIYREKEYAICTESHEQKNPVISGEHDLYRIYWQDSRNSTWDIYAYFFYTSLEGPLQWEYLVYTDHWYSHSNQRNPDYADGHLVYEDDKNGSWDIYQYVYDQTLYSILLNGHVEPVCTANGDQINPRTSKGRIVWEDHRNDNGDIYIWDRPPGVDLAVYQTVNRNPIQTGDTLIYEITAINLGPDDEDAAWVVVHLPVDAGLADTVMTKGICIRAGLSLTWNIGALQHDSSAVLKVYLITFEPAILNLSSEISGNGFDPDPSNNKVDETISVKTVVGTSIGKGIAPSMFVELSGVVHVVYFEHDTVYYLLKYPNSDWIYESPDTIWETNATSSDILKDPSGKVHIVYSDNTYQTYPQAHLYSLTRSDSGDWNKKIIALNDTGFYSISMALNSRNDIHLVYQDASGMAFSGPIKYMNNKSGTWNHPKTIGWGYDDLSMAIDKNDFLHISFYMPIQYMRSQDTVVNNWSMPETIDPNWAGGQMEGMVTDIGVDSSGHPHMVYVGSIDNSHQQNVRYAKKYGGKWHSEKIENGGFLSGGTAIAVEPSGKVHLTYVPNYSTGLKYATDIAGPWIKQIIDDDDYVILNTLDMGLDGDGNIHILYEKEDELIYVMMPPIVYFQIDPDTLDFGFVEIDSTATKYLKLYNDHSGTIHIDSVALTNPQGFDVPNRPIDLDIDQPDSIEVHFTPTDSTIYETTLQIYYNGTSGLYMEVPVRGNAPIPMLEAVPDPVDFGVVQSGSQKLEIVTLKNIGIGNLEISNIEVKKEVWGIVYRTDFHLVSQNCNVLGPGDSCEVQIEFSPQIPGDQTSFLHIYSNDPVTPERKITLSGHTPFAVISPETVELNFGYVGVNQAQSKTLKIKNTGDMDLILTDMTITGQDTSAFEVGNNCSTIPPGDSCELEMVFKPTQAKDCSATLNISSNALYNNDLNILLKGSSIWRNLEYNPEQIDFGDVVIGQEKARIVTFSNNDSNDVSITDVSVKGADMYEFDHSGCSGILKQGESLTDTIWFAPIFEGPKSAILHVRSDDSENENIDIPLYGNSLETEIPSFDISGSIVTPDGDPVNEGRIYVYQPDETSHQTYLWHKPLAGSNAFQINAIPQGKVTLRFDPDTSVYPGYLNTYLGNTVSWDQADFFILNKDTAGLVITVQPVPPAPGGTSNISGIFVEESGKSGSTLSYEKYSGNGTPVKNISVFITDRNGNIVDYDITDSTGIFGFENIPTGHYGFQADYVGFFMDDSNDSLIIDQENQKYYISAVAANDTITIEISNITDVNNLIDNDGFRIFPNPAQDVLMVQIPGSANPDKLVLSICGLNGKVLKWFPLTQVADVTVSRIKLDDLPSGIYIISIVGNHCNFKTRFMKY